ncbi:MAG TPA: DUF2089 domain-containing protein [Candidatus Limnocylindrales bacterium]
MSRDVISTCPVCSSELAVTRLQCRGCGTAIEGDFNVGRFGRLSRDQLALLESFLRARGNLKELERELKVSYPTVRARIDALVKFLGLGDAAPAADDATADASAAGRNGETVGLRREVLERLARHEVTADEAAALIRALGRSE